MKLNIFYYAPFPASFWIYFFPFSWFIVRIPGFETCLPWQNAIAQSLAPQLPQAKHQLHQPWYMSTVHPTVTGIICSLGPLLWRLPSQRLDRHHPQRRVRHHGWAVGQLSRHLHPRSAVARNPPSHQHGDQLLLARWLDTLCIDQFLFEYFSMW